jgi:hypothetical protein
MGAALLNQGLRQCSSPIELSNRKVRYTVANDTRSSLRNSR